MLRSCLLVVTFAFAALVTANAQQPKKPLTPQEKKKQEEAQKKAKEEAEKKKAEDKKRIEELLKKGKGWTPDEFRELAKLNTPIEDLVKVIGKPDHVEYGRRPDGTRSEGIKDNNTWTYNADRGLVVEPLTGQAQRVRFYVVPPKFGLVTFDSVPRPEKK